MKPTLISVHGINSHGGWFGRIVRSFEKHFDHLPVRYREYHFLGVTKLVIFPGILLVELFLLERFSSSIQRRWIVSGAVSGAAVGYIAMCLVKRYVRLRALWPLALIFVLLFLPYLWHGVFDRPRLAVMALLCLLAAYSTYSEFTWHGRVRLSSVGPILATGLSFLVFYNINEYLGIWTGVIGLLVVWETADVVYSRTPEYFWLAVALCTFGVVSWFIVYRYDLIGAVLVATIGGLLSVLEPYIRRERSLRSLVRKLDLHAKRLPGQERFIVAHSLGTFLIGRGLAHYPVAVNANRLLLLGSVLPTDFKWKDLGIPSLRAVRNEQG